MKKILFSLITLSVILTGCGKDNKTNSGSNTAASTTVTSTISTAQSSALEAVKSAIANDRFAYYTVNTYKVVYSTVSSYYTCSQKTGEVFGIDWLNYSYQSCSPQSSTNSEYDYNRNTNFETKRSELNNLLNGAEVIDGNTYVNYSNQTVAAIKIKKDGVSYILDTSYPIGANPVAKEVVETVNGTQVIKVKYVNKLLFLLVN